LISALQTEVCTLY